MSIVKYLVCMPLAILSCVAAFPQIPAHSKPNIVFILVDDFGYKDLGCTGSTYYETPNVDKLAAHSADFTRGYAACQVCSPSRASIMTGVYPTEHGITDYIGAQSGEKWRSQNRHSQLLPSYYANELALHFTTIPELLKQNGYATFFAGKWHLGSKGFFPQDQGFDINKGGNSAGHPARYFSPYDNDDLTNGPPGENLEKRLADETVKFITENKNKPFFAYLSFYAVHSPIQTTQKKWAHFREKAEQQGIRETGFKMERRLPVRQQQDNPVYAGLVSSMDDAVGDVLNTLKKLGLEKNTVVIFTSDNGGVVSGDNFSTNLFPLRGGKGYQWEGGLRVPVFIKVPWLFDTRTKIEVPVSGIDYLPTILELTNTMAKPSQKIDGVSMVPLLKGKKIAERNLYWHYPHYGNQGGDPSSVIQSGKWKLIHYYENGQNELYNLDEDQSEQFDKASANSTIVKDLYAKLEKWLKDTKALIPARDPQYNQAEEKKYQESIVNTVWPRQEKIRKDMLLKTWQPDKNWWGSEKANNVKK